MNWIKAAVVGAAIVACAACSDYDNDASPFAGSWTGTWVAIDDPEDAGTSRWEISSTGQITGLDFDPAPINYTVTGTIADDGAVTTVATPNNGQGPSNLNGKLAFEPNRRLSGNLVWGVLPPITYRYSFARTQ